MSMIYVRKIDCNGFLIADAFVAEVSETDIETPCPSGFFRPKWDGENWVEGLSQAEIDTIKASTTPEKTLEQRVEEMAEQLVLAQEALDFIIMGGI